MSTAAPTVGIDAIAFAGPAAYLEMADLATARGVDPAKFVHGLGQRRMAVPSPCEDTVTMAVDAAGAALAAFQVDPADIGTLIVGTETGVDHSKPVAVYVHELLGLSSNCRTFETKHACYGAMAGLTSAMDWIASGRARGRKALIIASDIARYGLATPGEPTQGAGAVAMVVSAAPRLLAIDAAHMGDYTRQVMDFWRPLYSKYAFADGHYSIECYLEALSAARDDAFSQGGQAPGMDALAACFYHVPFGKMALKAHRRHWRDAAGHSAKTEDDSAFETSYQQQVAPWLSLNEVIGNIYTGSLFLSIMDFLRRAPESEAERPLSLFSYGSGCGAAFCLARAVPGFSAYANALDPEPSLDRRRQLSVAEYEAMLAACEACDLGQDIDLNPADWGLSEGLYYLGTRDHVRRYGQVNTPAMAHRA